MEQTQQESPAHKHDIIYYGVVNLIRDSNVIGAIDVWKCRKCAEIFCEDKRYGVMDLAAEVGFPKIPPGSKWAALVCTKDKVSDWTLTGAKPGIVISHSCTPETKVDLRIGEDYGIMTDVASGIGVHRIILLEKFVNSAVDVITGKPHTGPTNANPAPGRPFSFVPERSAASLEKQSLLNVYTFNALTFFIASIWTTYTGTVIGASLLTRTLLVASGIVGLIAGYFTLNKKIIGPITGLGSSIAGIVGFILVYPVVEQNPSLAVLLILNIANLPLAWISRVRIKRLTELQWHPLDMPAYG
ncbi:MAG TPA: hypothetical protein VE177_00340 [Candidatus Binatus sp.]|nr:hypothetical protein [Candidatus Binatus sp.]